MQVYYLNCCGEMTWNRNSILASTPNLGPKVGVPQVSQVPKNLADENVVIANEEIYAGKNYMVYY